MSNPNAVTVDFTPGGIRKIQLYVTSKWAKKTASQVRKLTGADVVINASLYDSNKWVPNCDVKANGKVLNNDRYTYRGIAWNNDDGEFHIATSGEMGKWDNFLSCVLLIWNGKPYPYTADAAVSRRSGRTALIQRKNGHLLLWCGGEGQPESPGAPEDPSRPVSGCGLGSDAGWRRQRSALPGRERLHLLLPPGPQLFVFLAAGH